MPSAETTSRTAFVGGFLPLLFFALSYYYPFARSFFGRHIDSRIQSRRTGSGVRAFIEFNRSWSRGYVGFWRSIRWPAFAAFVLVESTALVFWFVSR